MNRKLKRRIALRKRVQRSIENNKALSGMIFAYFILSINFGAFANVLTDLNEWMIGPYQWISKWDSAGGFLDWVHFNLMFWPMAGVFWSLRSFCLFIWQKYIVQTEDEPVAPLVLYKDEFAVAVEAIDQVNHTDPDEAILELMDTVAETIAVNLGLRKKDYRMMMFTPIPLEEPEEDGEKDLRIAGLRFGKHFELVEQGKLDAESFYPRDIKNIFDCLEQENTELVIPNVSFGDAKTVLFTRNPGDLRLGLYIGVLRTDFDIEMAKVVFPQVAHIITTLGFVDEMVEFIVEYEQRGKGN